MIICLVDGKHAGNCSMQFHDKIKVRHRGEVAIALLQEFWGMGIGTVMFEEMIRLAREYGASQLELGMVDGNERGLALYRKMGKHFQTLDSWQIYVLTANENFERLYGRRADKVRKLYNGMLRCGYYQFFKAPKRDK